MFKKILALSILMPMLAFSTELKPWYDRELEIHSRTTYWLQSFHHLDVSHGPSQYRSNDSFLTLSLLAARLAWCFEGEAAAAKTRRHPFGMDHIKLTGRYLWLSDVLADPISLTTGVSISSVFKPARHDIGSFHHGGIETEFHAAVGRESSCYQFWTSRWWSVVGLGIGDIGSPWIRLDADWEHNWWDTQKLRLFAHTLWGLGHRSLSLKKHFPGYGYIRHQSIDVGARYSYLFYCGVTLSLEYARRLYAENCPRNVNFFLVQLHYSFPIPYGFGL